MQMGGQAGFPSRPQASPGTLQMGLVATLVALAVLAWVLTGERMDWMAMGPGGDLGGLGFYVTTWVVMMAAMMFPSISPMVRTYALVARRKEGRDGTVSAPPAIALFVAGYLVTWTVFGLAAFGAIELVRGLDIEALSWSEGGPYLAGVVILAAAAYQLTPAKDACLTRCRSPLDFLLERWRAGLGGALALGVEHGAWCVGCCWALMAALFALGVMSIGWMAFVAALIAIEKLVPWKRLANRGIAVGLAALGLAVAFVPGSVPGLSSPVAETSARHSAEPAGGMEGMEPSREAGSMESMP
jgi:predicted metal-binding membrane protein